jgi:inosose dehydratase
MDRATVGEQRIKHPYEQTKTIAVGTAPVNWNNDDLPNWRPRVPFTNMLDAMASAGYQGTEFGADFPRDPSQLKSELSIRDLERCGSYQWFHFQDPEKFAGEIADLDHVFRALASVGCQNLIVASAMTPERIAIAGRVPGDGSASWSTQAWLRLRDGLAQLRDRAREWQLEVHYHNHVGSHVESPDEVEILMQYLPDEVDLCFDTGHYAFGGGDAADFVRKHSSRIGYLHLKDVDPSALAIARDASLGFLDALRHFVFCELGQGCAGISRIVSTLGTRGYCGWVIVEQDTCPNDPTVTARRNRAFLRDACGI